MKLTELIDKLNKIKSEEGDMLVVTPGINEFNYKEVRLVATLNVAKIIEARLGFGEEYAENQTTIIDSAICNPQSVKSVVINW